CPTPRRPATGRCTRPGAPARNHRARGGGCGRGRPRVRHRRPATAAVPRGFPRGAACAVVPPGGKGSPLRPPPRPGPLPTITTGPAPPRPGSGPPRPGSGTRAGSASVIGGPDGVLTEARLTHFVSEQLAGQDLDGRSVCLLVPDRTRSCPLPLLLSA